METLNLAIQRGFLIASGIFLCAFILQILVWRLFKPKREMLLLLIIYFFAPAAFLIILSLQKFLLLDLLACAVLFFSAATAYVMSFPAIQAQSPSLGMLLFIKARGGCSINEIASTFGKNSLLEERIQDLENDRLIKADGSLAWSGKLLAIFFKQYRQLLHMTEKNG